MPGDGDSSCQNSNRDGATRLDSYSKELAGIDQDLNSKHAFSGQKDSILPAISLDHIFLHSQFKIDSFSCQPGMSLIKHLIVIRHRTHRCVHMHVFTVHNTSYAWALSPDKR